MRKILALLLAASVAMSATACSSGAAISNAAPASSGETPSAARADFKVSMVADTGGVNDQSFSQLSWEGLQKLKADNGADISYAESKQEADYATDPDKAIDDENNLVWDVGSAMNGVILSAAKAGPDVQFAIMDNVYKETPSNLATIMFRAQKPSFLVGYIAAKTTKTNKVGFVGGVKNGVIDQFEYSYKAGVAYGAEGMGKAVEVVAQHAGGFIDSAKGKAVVSRMLSGRCDIIFRAVGNVGTDVIETAKEASRHAIGVDRDQAFLAPSNVLTSALKKVDKAVEEVSKEIMDDRATGGTAINLGVKGETAGIPEEHKLMGKETYKAAAALQDQIKDGRLVPPASGEGYNTFVKNLK